MKKRFLFITLIVTLGLILPLILVYAGETIDEPNDASTRMPTIISGSGTDQVTNEAPSAEEGNIAKLVQYIYTFALLAAGLAVIGGLIYGGVRYLFAGGSITKMFAARSQVRNALYGLGLILISYLILYTINPALVNLVNPTADPLKLKVSPIWSLSMSYGSKLANVPSGRPCLYDEDCTYDLACCPAQTPNGQEVTGCNQDMYGTALAENKTDLVSVPSAEATGLKWFSCGWGESHWFGGSCPNASPNAIKKSVECSETVKTDCCDPNTKPSADKNPVCCQQPLMVTAKDEAECRTTYGSQAPQATQAKYNNCACDTRVATCQPIKPPAEDTINRYSWIDIFKLNPKKMLKLSKYGDNCFADYKQISGLGIFGFKDYTNSSCRDQRLVCSTQMRICVEPGEVGTSCKKHTIFPNIDCCGVKQRNTATPNCNKYTSRYISLYCEDSGDGIGQCMLSEEDAKKIEEDGGTGGTGIEVNPDAGGGTPKLICIITAKDGDKTCGQIDPTRPLDGDLAKNCSWGGAADRLCCCQNPAVPTGWQSTVTNGGAMAVSNPGAQIVHSSQAIIGFVNYLNSDYPAKGKWQITALTDKSDISGSTQRLTECSVTNRDPDVSCGHGGLCHYGGKNNVCNGSVAVDIQTTDPDIKSQTGDKSPTTGNAIYQKLKSLATNYTVPDGKSGVWINPEPDNNHIHFSLGSALNCGCN